MGYLIEVLSYDISEVTASRVEHDAAHTVVVLLDLDEVVAAAEGACLKVALLYLGNELLIGFKAAHFSLGAVQHL